MEYQINKLAEVYGNSRQIPLTYQTRDKIDTRFINDLNRNKHIVLHSGSKQGKTCLRKHHLKEGDCICIQCTRDMPMQSLYENILKKAEIEFKVSSEITTKGTHKISAKLSAEGSIPLIAKGKGEGGYDYNSEKGNTSSYKFLEIDPEDPNDIVRILKMNNFDKLIVIEDFHYLDEDVQRQFSFDMKIFHESSNIVFVIVGVWLESNRLIVYNGDLSGRITNINVDEWQQEQLEKVILEGFPLLNISFPEDVIKEILKIGKNNVGIVQELCYRICENNDIWDTIEDNLVIGTVEEVKEIAKTITDDLAPRYLTFIRKFSEGLSVTELEIYKWIMYVILNTKYSILKKGLAPNKILNKIKQKHPKKDKVQLSHINQALERVHKVQSKHRLQPFILDYSNGELVVTDTSFLNFIETRPIEGLIQEININAT